MKKSNFAINAKLLERILAEICVDTANYRYQMGFDANGVYVTRVSLSILDTMAAYDPSNWEIKYL